MKARLMLAAALLGLAAPAMASQMSAGEFLGRAQPLLKKSKMSLIFSGEARRLMKTLGEAARKNRAQLDAERAAGRPVATCLPPKGKASVNATELLAYIRAMPPAQQADSFDAAFASYTARKYPCKA